MLVALLGSTARAGGAQRVAIVGDLRAAAFSARLQGELRFLGFKPVMISRRVVAGDLMPQAYMRASRARVALIVDAAANRVTLWFAEPQRAGRGAAITSLDTTPPDAALRAAELVRAHYALDSAAEALEAQALYARTGLRLSAGSMFSAGGLSPMAVVLLALGFRPRGWLEVEALVAGPLYPGQVDAPEGRGSVFAGFAGLGPLFQLLPRARRTELFIGAGLALGIVHMRGQANAELAGTNDWLVSGIGYARAALRLKLGKRVAIRLEGLTGIAVPRPVVTFVGRAVAAWGRPLGAVSAGMELSL